MAMSRIKHLVSSTKPDARNSCAEENAHDFERLEFLGDAVVDLVVGEELYRRFPDATEGELTALRAALVSSAALAAARAVGRRRLPRSLSAWPMWPPHRLSTRR